jgi:hypothetical protein
MISAMTAAPAPALDSSDGVPASSASRPAERARRTMRRGVLAVLVMAVVLLPLDLLYRPLEHLDGMTWAGQVTGDRGRFGLGPGATNLENTFGSELVVRPMPQGGRLGLLVDLRNRGPLPVTVLGVEPLLLEGYSRGTRLFVGDDADSAATLRPARSFTVPAHGYRTVGFAVDVRTDCAPGTPGSRVTVDQVRLRYRFAGIPRTRTIHLNELAVSLDAPPTCP